MYFKIIFVLLLVTKLYADDRVDIKAEISQNLSEWSYSVRPPESGTLRLDISLEDAYKKKIDESNSVDIVLLIDNTSSMGDVIDMIKTQMDDISAFLLRNYPNVKIAISSISDHSEEDVYQLIQDFTGDTGLLKANISTLALVNGGDAAEAYLYGLNRVLELSWRETSQKVVFIIGDAYGHSPDNGKDGKPDTADDIHEETLLGAYKEKKIKICSYFNADSNASTKYFANLSDVTDGFSKPIELKSNVRKDFEEMLNAIVGVHYLINEPFHSHAAVKEVDDHYLFDFDLKLLDLTANHLIKVDLTNNRARIGSVSVEFVTGKPWGMLILLGIPLLCFLVYTALKHIYKRTKTTTIVDLAYLKHYAVLVFALVLYAAILFVVWICINQSGMPIIWEKFWW